MVVDFLYDPIKGFFDLFVSEEEEEQQVNEENNNEIPITIIETYQANKEDNNLVVVSTEETREPQKIDQNFLCAISGEEFLFGGIILIVLLSISFPLLFSWVDEIFDKKSKGKGKDTKITPTCSFYDEDGYDFNWDFHRCESNKNSEDQLRGLDYSELLKHPKWKEKRLKILQRDNFRCVVCGYDKKLQIHHKRYKTDPKTGKRILPWEYDDDDLVTLCDLHHRRIHGK